MSKIDQYTINGTAPINAQQLVESKANEKLPGAHRFQPGNKLGGRPKGSKNKITKLFIDDLTHEWRNRGCQALSELTGRDLVRTCVAVLPKDVLVALGDSETTRWVINASPKDLDESEWRKLHGLDQVDPDGG